jgi:hypothetical protein
MGVGTRRRCGKREYHPCRYLHSAPRRCTKTLLTESSWLLRCISMKTPAKAHSSRSLTRRGDDPRPRAIGEWSGCGRGFRACGSGLGSSGHPAGKDPNPRDCIKECDVRRPAIRGPLNSTMCCRRPIEADRGVLVEAAERISKLPALLFPGKSGFPGQATSIRFSELTL